MPTEREPSDWGTGIPSRRPPAFNVPAVVLAFILLLVAVHLLRLYGLDRREDLEALLDFSFIAGCVTGSDEICSLRLEGASFWTPATHALLHADWTHLGANSLWLLAFGTPIARRIGTLRFLAFAIGGAVSGAALFFALNPDLIAPMIGASGVVSAVMGGAARFALAEVGRYGRRDIAFAPRLGLAESLSNRTVVIFVAIFFATNLLIGAGIGTGIAGAVQIAWEAHLGGFVFGFLLFALFDPEHGFRRSS